MIPLLMPPLTNLHILVTRPALQAASLCQRLQALGAEVTTLPVLELTPCAHVVPGTTYDLLVFISANAVKYGQAILAAQPQARIAAVGASTAQALTNAGHAVDVTPQSATSSEALLAHPLLQTPPARILIVRGVGGRELLRDALTMRGAQVDVVEVYRRERAQPEQTLLHALSNHLQQETIDVMTLTSVDIAESLLHLLNPADRERALHTAMLAGSHRIAQAARALGWRGECILAASPEDEALIAALTRWHTRSRSELLR